MEQANYYNFAGRHAVITGGAAGIGLAIARRLAAGGASLTLWDRDIAQLQEAKAALGSSGYVQCVTVDVSSAEQVNAARNATVEGGGEVDILVNSAGIGLRHAAVEHPLADWDRVVAVNLTGVFLCSRIAARSMTTAAAARSSTSPRLWGSRVAASTRTCRIRRPRAPSST